jgi:hypothetical protein
MAKTIPQRANVLTISEHKNGAIAKLWREARDRDRGKVPVVAVASSFGDLLLIHRADLPDVTRRTGELSASLGPI